MIDLLVVGAHPDDAELGAGGLVRLALERDLRVGIVCLTRGEQGARGTAEERSAEARAAAARLGVEVLRLLDLGDTRLAAEPGSLAALEQLLIELQPRHIVTHDPQDWNPDHRAAWEIVDRAWALANRASRHGDRLLHRPRLLRFAVDIRRAPRPQLLVDITSVWAHKSAALACHASQAQVLAKVEVLARYYGSLAGVEFGEGFVSPEPLVIGPDLGLL